MFRKTDQAASQEQEEQERQEGKGKSFHGGKLNVTDTHQVEAHPCTRSDRLHTGIPSST